MGIIMGTTIGVLRDTRSLDYSSHGLSCSRFACEGLNYRRNLVLHHRTGN